MKQSINNSSSVNQKSEILEKKDTKEKKPEKFLYCDYVIFLCCEFVWRIL